MDQNIKILFCICLGCLWEQLHPWKCSRTGWKGFWAAWWKVSLLMVGGWNWIFKVPPNPNNLWFCDTKLYWQFWKLFPNHLQPGYTLSPYLLSPEFGIFGEKNHQNSKINKNIEGNKSFSMNCCQALFEIAKPQHLNVFCITPHEYPAAKPADFCSATRREFPWEPFELCDIEKPDQKCQKKKGYKQPNQLKITLSWNFFKKVSGKYICLRNLSKSWE